jgi:hypothetical protein
MTQRFHRLRERQHLRPDHGLFRMSDERNCPTCGSTLKPAMLKCMECGTRLSIRPMSGSAPDSKLHVAGNRTAEASEASTATIARPTLDRVHKGCPVSTEAPLERPKLAGQRSGSSEPEVAVPREPSVAVNSESSRICECPCGA